MDEGQGFFLESTEKVLCVFWMSPKMEKTSWMYDQGILTYYVGGSITSDSQRNLPYRQPPECYSILWCFALNVGNFYSILK